MVNKTLLGLAIAAASLTLAGCNISSVDSDAQVDQAPVEAGSDGTTAQVVTPLFNPARSILPLATDFLFKTYPTDASGNALDATDVDGTLYYAAGKNIDPLLADGSVNPNYNPVYDAINDLEGFSTSGQIYIEFNGSLAAEQPAGSVYLVPLNYDGGPKKGTLVSDSPFQYLKIPPVQADVITDEEGTVNSNVLRISPLQPLMPNTRYLVVILKTLQDADGNNIDMPSQYQYLAGDDDLLSAALVAVRASVKGWKQLADGFVAAVLQRDVDVSLAYTFTTTSTTDVMNVMAAPGNADSALTNAAIPAAVQNYLNTTDDDSATQLATLTYMTGSSVAAQQLIAGNTLLSTLAAPAPRKTDFSTSAAVPTALLVSGSASSFRTGRIQLPYFQKAPNGAYAGEDPTTGYVCQEATAECGQQRLTAANVMTSQWQSNANVISNLKLATGSDASVAAAYAAPSENVTALFPFAAPQGTLSVPVLVVEPVASCDKPDAGWPVVIYQHGLGSNRMATLPLAEQFAEHCYATVAIDLPLHGPMPTDTFSYAGYTIPLLAAVAGSENSAYGLSTFLGLPSTTQTAIVTGQTISQRHFGLTADGLAPAAVSATDASANASGSLYINFVRFQGTRDNTRQGVMDLLNLNASIPFMDIDHDGHADFDASNIYFAGISLGSIVGEQFVAVNNANTLSANAVGNSALNPIKAAAFGVPGGGLAKLLEHSDTYGPTIVGALTGADGFNLTRGGLSYESLLTVYQATVDGADPLNYAKQLAATGTPYTLIKSVGDAVIPNSVADAPLAGTDPLIATLGATAVDTSTNLSAVSPVQITVSLSDELSSHISMAVPDSSDSTPETAATFATIASHIISLYDNTTAPTLDDSGAGIVETVTE
jgi:trimeric autotransporter adhesin